MWGTVNPVHATTGIGLTLLVLGGAGCAISAVAIVFDRYLDRRARRMRDQLPRAQLQPPDARRS